MTVAESSKVADVKLLAQQQFQQGFLRLITAWGYVLSDLEESVEAAELEEGDHLTAIAQQARLAATGSAFALWIYGGDKILTWGSAYNGGRSTSIQKKLKNVQQVQATLHAFAAVLADGSVVTWGSHRCGGDSSFVSDQLRGVQRVEATAGAFAAILKDGSVVTWGAPDLGGDSSGVQDQLKKVKHVQTTQAAFAAILADGSVTTWGDPRSGGDSSDVQDQLRNVQHIQASDGAFAAMPPG